MHPARITGLLYLAIIVCGIFAEIVVRSGLIVADNPAATADNIRNSGALFRAVIVLAIVALLTTG